MDLVTRGTVLFILFMEVFVISCERARPTGMKQGIYCECCSATVKEISKKLQKKSSDPWDVRVIEAMEGICKASSFREYDYSPPTTVKGCRYLIENYEEEIEQIFTSKKSDPEKKICYELTLACEGVDRSKKEKEDMNVNVNGQQQTPDDGINRLNVDINDPNSAARLAEQIKQQMAMQQANGGTTDYDDDEEEPEEGEADDGENLLDNYDEDGNEKPEADGKEGEKKEDSIEEPKEDEKKEEEKTSKNEKTEL